MLSPEPVEKLDGTHTLHTHTSQLCFAVHSGVKKKTVFVQSVFVPYYEYTN